VKRLKHQSKWSTSPSKVPSSMMPLLTPKTCTQASFEPYLDQQGICVLFVHKLIFVYMFVYLLSLCIILPWSRVTPFRWICLSGVTLHNCLFMLSFGRNQEGARSPLLVSYKMLDLIILDSYEWFKILSYFEWWIETWTSVLGQVEIGALLVRLVELIKD
jgi:hypothetical protein